MPVVNEPRSVVAQPLHGAILLVMGIASFSIAMVGALLILLIPADSTWSLLANRWYTTAPIKRDSKEEVPSVAS